MSSLLAVVWSAVATFAGWRFNWSWPDDFKTTYPDLSEELYLLTHLIANSALVSNGLVEYLAKFGLRFWFGDAKQGGSEERQSLLTPSQNQGKGFRWSWRKCLNL